jgi:glycosyltransferase involved in cell wall biosynthesis
MPKSQRKRHLLVINQFFWPDSAPTGQLLADVTRIIEGRQHGTTAICAAAGYNVKDGQTSAPPVRILRSKSIPFSRNVLGRVLSYASFLLGAVWNGFRIGHPDIVLTMTTPPLTSVLGRLLKLSRGCRHYIWEMDLYPDIAIDLGVMRSDSFLTTIIGALADWSRRNCDGIIALGEDMKARLIARGIPEHLIHVAENWADGQMITPCPFPEGPLVIQYSGNLGLAHDIGTIADAMRHLRNDPRFQFVFAGGGVKRKELENFCHEHAIGNVLFKPYCAWGELSASLGEGHIGLVTQLPETCGSLVPGKTYGIMASGRPMLYIGPREATPARIIDRHQCGWRIEPGDSSALVALLERLAADRNLVYEAGGRCRTAFDEYYDRPIAAARVAAILGLQPTVPVTEPEPKLAQAAVC